MHRKIVDYCYFYLVESLVTVAVEKLILFTLLTSSNLFRNTSFMKGRHAVDPLGKLSQREQ